MSIQVYDYIGLIQELGNIISGSKKKVVSSINTVLVETYWNIGKYLIEYEQKGEKRAEYGKTLIKNISQDLTREFGKGFSERNLQQMKQFYVQFSNLQTLSAEFREKIFTSLSWSHCVRLSSVRDENERSFYIIETIENSWSVRELDRQINTAQSQIGIIHRYMIFLRNPRFYSRPILALGVLVLKTMEFWFGDFGLLFGKILK